MPLMAVSFQKLTPKSHPGVVRLDLESWVGSGEQKRKGEKHSWHNSVTVLGKGRGLQ